MKTVIVDGKKLAEKKEKQLRKKVIKLEKTGRRPGLAVLVIKDDKAGHFQDQIYLELLR